MTSKEAKYDEWLRYFFEVDKEMYNLFKQDLERKEQLEKENQELKEEIQDLKDNETIVADYGVDLWNENEKLKKAIKMLKPILDIYAGEGKGYIDCCVENPIITFDLYNDKEFKLYNSLKEVLGNEK